MKLDKLKEKFRKYSREIDKLEDYISTLKQGDVLDADVIAKRLNTTFPIALLILANAESLDILRKGYQVFANGTDMPLGEFEKENEIPEVIYNPHTNREISEDNFYIDLVYHPVFNLEKV
ncbi:hypothetical protein [Tenacibaculum agarivorans]|uniref:hypothetical protein n=1 Tax=Tenacibaculum agarivorans TaxID=1908389 RepID=UPI00094BAE8E|nr:hypothetical protein [Tenacibaculum agarivorans]